MVKVKQFLSCFLALLILLSVPMFVSASSEIKVYIDNKEVNFDVPPQLIGGRTMVPLRAIFEGLGATVQWDEATRTVTAYNEVVIVKATIDVNIMTINNEERSMDVPPMLVNGRTLVPARFVAEAFGCDVQWNADERSVYITTFEIDYGSLEQETHQNSNTINNETYPTVLGNIVPYEGTSNIIDYGKYTGANIISYGEQDGVYVYYYNLAIADWLISYCTVLENYGWEMIEFNDFMDEEDGYCEMKYMSGANYIWIFFDLANNQTAIVYQPEITQYYPNSSVITYTSVTGVNLLSVEETDHSYGYLYDITFADDIILYLETVEQYGWNFVAVYDPEDSDSICYIYERDDENLMVFIYPSNKKLCVVVDKPDT